MSVTGVGGNAAASDVSALMRTLRASTVAVDATDNGEVKRTDSAKFSGPAEFMSKLQKLKESDPEKFKEVIQRVADKLASAAEAETDEHAKKMLTALAEKFSSVAEGGELSQLEPPKPPSLSGNGQKAYGAGGQPDQKMLGEMMRPQGPPPGPPPGASAEVTEDSSSTSDSASSTTEASGMDLRDTLKSIFDELNDSLTQALSSHG